MIPIFIIGAIVVLIILVIGYGALYETTAMRRAAELYNDPIGERITVDGRKVHVHITGERHSGQPAVVLEASVGANSLDWQMVQPLIAEHAQVVSYDRAGNGWSDPVESPRSADILMDELRHILQAADVPPPYVLVGHRYGGMYNRKYQELFPDDVAGIVLLDSSHPDVFDEDNSDEIKRLERNVNIFQKLGLVRAVTRRNYRVEFLDGDDKERYIAMMMNDNPNLLREARPVLTDGIDLPDAIDVPLIVLSRNEDPDLIRERKWAERQRDLVALSDDAEHLHTETRKSWIVFAEPQTIADTVVKMVNKVTNNSTEEL